MKVIAPESLLCMNNYAEEYPLRIDLAYARADNLLFDERIYRPDAKLWLHTDLAAVVLLASKICYDQYRHRFVLYDGLRTLDAQKKMLETQRVRDNPHWLKEPRLLSPPGQGGHPRGMAIDISLEDESGNLLDMGTPFDFLAENPNPLHNPAHRQHPKVSKQAVRNRNILNLAMVDAAKALNTPLLLLPQEWWDFRVPPATYEQFEPLSDKDLPEEMRMVEERREKKEERRA